MVIVKNKIILLPGNKIIIFTSIFLKEWKYGDGKKIVFEIIADSDCTTLKT